MYPIKRFAIIFFVICSCINIYGQNSKLDSLMNLYKKADYDSTRCRLMLAIGSQYQNQLPDTSLSWFNKVYIMATKTINKEEIYRYYAAFALQSKGSLEYNYMGNYDKALEYSGKSFTIYENLAKTSNIKELIQKSLNGISSCYRISGLAYLRKGNYDKAMGNFFKSLEINEKLSDKKAITECYNNISLVYSDKGSYNLAIEYLFKALKINEELNNKKGMAFCYGNIANVYFNQKNFNKAIEYNMNALKISEELGYKKGIALSYANVGIYLGAQVDEIQAQGGNQDSIKNKRLQAINYFLKSLKISEEIGDQFQISLCYNSIGNLYAVTDNKIQALEYYSKSLKIYEELGDKYFLVFSYVNFAELNLNVTDSTNISKSALNLQTAIKYANKGYELAKSINSVTAENIATKTLMNAYNKTGNYKKAMEYAKIFINTNDSLFQEKQTNAIANAEAKFNSEKKQLQIEKLNKEKELQQETNRRQKNVIFFIGIGLLLIIIIALIIFRSLKLTRQQKKIIEKEKQRSEELLLNIIPYDTAQELKKYGGSKPKHFEMATVLFTDFKDFTMISEKMTPNDLVAELNYCFTKFDEIISKYPIEKIKTIGDSYMCAGGLPVANNTNAFDLVNAALEIRQFMIDDKLLKEKEGKLSFEIRIGIHTGPIVAGIVGIKKFSYDIWGDTVNTASRMESSGELGKINISETTYDLVKDKFKCTYRGKIPAKNKGEIGMYFVEDLG